MLAGKISINKLIAGIILCSMLFKPITGWKGYFVINILAFLLFAYYQKTVKCKFTAFEKMYFVFYLGMIIGALWAPVFPTYLLFLTLFFLCQVFIFRVTIFSGKYSVEEGLHFLTNCFSNATIVICLYSILVEGITMRLGAITFADVGTRIELSLDLYIAFAFCFFELMWKTETGKNKLLVWKIIRLLFLFLCICMSGTRKILLGVVITACVMLFYKDKNNFLKILRLLVLSTILIAIGYYLIMNVPILYEQIGHRIEVMINITFRGYGFEESIEERGQLRNYAIALFKEHPILGVGTQGFQWYSDSALNKLMYSHCNFTELLANHGVIGFCLYYIIPVYLFMQAHLCKNVRNRAIIYALTVTILIMDYSQVSYYQIQYLLLFEVMFSLLAIEKGYFGALNDCN